MASNIKTNHGYITFFTVTFLFGSTLQGGWALAECGQVSLVLDKKLNWGVFSRDKAEDEKSAFLNNVTMITVLGHLGMSLGCYIGGMVLPKFGSRKVIIGANIIAIIFNIIKLIENTTALMIGRIMFGVTMGVSLVGLSRAINDTVPAQSQQIYGAFVNAGFGIGIFVSNLLGLLIPLDNGKVGDVQKMIDDQNWRIVFGFPILLEIYTVLALIFVIKNESMIQLLQKEDPSTELVQTELKKIYTIPSTMTYEQLGNKLKSQIKFKETVPCTVYQGFKSKQYRRASINGLLLAIFHQLTGMSGLQNFQTAILQKLDKEGTFPIPVIWAVQIINFTNMLACFSFAATSKWFR